MASEIKNGNGWLVRWLVGALFSVIFTILTVLGNNVIANDKESRKRDDEIKETVQLELKEVHNQQTAILTQQAAMNANQQNILQVLVEIKQAIKNNN